MSDYVIDRGGGIHEYKVTKQIRNYRSKNVDEIE
jgi:hypothetical protein